MSKYYYNKDYFQIIDTADKAYWLGFLYADGCILQYIKNEKIQSMGLELSLCRADRNHLKKLLDCLDSNIPIHDRINKLNGKEYKSSRINVCCTKMCYDLIKLGCTPKKTYDLKFPTNDIVPEEFKRDFIRGFFDGDGCISIQDSKNHIELSLSGVAEILEELVNYLVNNKIICVYPKMYKDKRSNTKSFYIYGDNAKDFLDYIYQDAKTYLDRKYNKYIDFYDGWILDRHGVYWNKENKAYVVTISINNINYRVGQSKSLEEAIKMRREAEIEK